MPTPSILILPRRVNNSWPAGFTKAEVSPSVCTPLLPSLFTPHQILYSPSLTHMKTSTISTSGHRFKLQTYQRKRDVAKNQFCNRVVCNWHNLPSWFYCCHWHHCSLQESILDCTFRSGTDFQPTLLLGIAWWLPALHLFFYSYVFSAVFISHHCGRL